LSGVIATANAAGFILLGGPGGGGGGGGGTCASTGIFDLSNVCNDIYFIGALK
jgi:hypothetical protein